MDVFLAKLNQVGSGLVYATFLGGSGLDIGNAVAVDGAGSAYVAGYTRSSDFPPRRAPWTGATMGILMPSWRC